MSDDDMTQEERIAFLEAKASELETICDYLRLHASRSYLQRRRPHSNPGVCRQRYLWIRGWRGDARRVSGRSQKRIP